MNHIQMSKGFSSFVKDCYFLFYNLHSIFEFNESEENTSKVQ